MNRAEILAWTPSWRSFQLFNGYRLLLAFMLVLMPLLPGYELGGISPEDRRLFHSLGIAYFLLVGTGALVSFRWKNRFHAQLTLQILVDVLGINTLMLVLGGLKSGLGVMLLVSVAGASLVARGRLALFYAALATLSVLMLELLGAWSRTTDSARVVQAGFLSMGFFATAISAHLLGRRVVSNEELARRRGEALENQIHISRRVMERMQDGVLVVGPEGRILQANPVALEILGELAGEGDFLARIAPELARSYVAWRDGDGEKRVELMGPAERRLAIRFARTKSSDGAALVFIEDLSKLENQALQMKLASLGRLTASIAHEIRNPLAAISHAGELLAEEDGGPMHGRLLRIVRDNTQRLDRIIQDVLVLGRQRVLAQETILLYAFLCEFSRELLEQEGLDPTLIQVQAMEEARLNFEPGQLRQVLWNLVDNALRHSSRHPGAVRLEVRLPGDGVELHVIDDGPGIPRDLRQQVFEPFFTTGPRGTGLGLHIARELCEANGARLVLGPDGSGGHFVLTGRSEPCQLQVMREEREES